MDGSVSVILLLATVSIIILYCKCPIASSIEDLMEASEGFASAPKFHYLLNKKFRGQFTM